MNWIKRITYLERREDLAPLEFSDHWRTKHAEIAKNLPSVVSYRQNHVTDVVARPHNHLEYPIDGIVELWFTDQRSFDAGYVSEVASRLASDEPNFLQGMVGSAVVSGGPTETVSSKVWVLGRGTEHLAELVDTIRASVDAVFVQGNAADLARPLLVRERLRADPEPPNIAISIGFGSREAAAQAAASVADLVSASPLERAQVVIADEITVI